MTTQLIILISILSMFSFISLLVSIYVNKAVFLPYMDEIFHIPQAQLYCHGNYSYWDPKLTTPPGLYLISVGLFQPLSQYVSNMCTLIQLRTVNMIFSSTTLCVIFLILKQINTTNQSKRFSWFLAGLSTLTIATFPTLYFFSFLYYTDAGSTFFVLLAYYLALKKYYFWSGLTGGISLWFRQTNIVWIVFCSYLSFNDFLIKYEGKHLRRFNPNSLKYFVGFHFNILNLLKKIWMVKKRKNSFLILLTDCIAHFSMYALDVVSFLIFIYWNDGIALGDRSSHQTSLHLPQLCYFALFTLIFASAHMLNAENVQKYVSSFRKNYVFYGICALTLFFVLAFNTRFHFYNLSDNRHFTFYFYSKLIRRHSLIKYALIPVYMFGWYVILNTLSRSRDIVWIFYFLTCLTVNLVFQSLLEFRYFILGYLIFRLNIPLSNTKLTHAATELVLYTLVNSYTIYLFVMRPFVRNDDDVLARFMW